MRKKAGISMSSFFYGIKQGIKNIFRNRLFSLASIGTITACLFIFGVFYCMVMNFQFIFAEVETTVGVTVFFDQGVDEAQIMEIKSQIETRDEVNEVNYTSPEEAWEDYKNKAFPDGDQDILTNLDEDNPLADSASLEVYLNDTEMQSELVAYIESIEGVRSVNASESVAESFASFGRLLSYVSLAIIIILVCVAVFLISNTVTIGITVRHEEIAIMKYLGATDLFVRGPFLVEGMVIGLIGSLIPVVVLRILYEKVVDFVTTEFSILNSILTFMPADDIFRILLPVSLIIGLGIGFIGSYLTLLKHVRV
jgi:cell division transport system permease protein